MGAALQDEQGYDIVKVMTMTFDTPIDWSKARTNRRDLVALADAWQAIPATWKA
jgi:hypothetical protein